MRYTIDLPDDLVRDAMRLTGHKTKREVVTLALEELVRKRRLERLRARLGQGNLDLTLEELCRMRGHD